MRFNIRLVIQVILAVAALLLTCRAQHDPSAYQGQEKREIKALSDQDIQGYLNGEGMGLARAAELNQYPGPKHVLELASQLQMSRKQIEDTQRAYDRMHAEAVRLGREIVESERHLDHLFASKQLDAPKLNRAVGEISRLQGELRTTHLAAHLQMRRVLTQAQVDRYTELRGYKSGSDDKDHKHGEK